MHRSKRRLLVLGNEAARHWLRVQLPPAAPLPAAPRWRPAWLTSQNLRDFLLAYCACFLAVSVYIA